MNFISEDVDQFLLTAALTVFPPVFFHIKVLVLIYYCFYSNRSFAETDGGMVCSPQTVLHGFFFLAQMQIIIMVDTVRFSVYLTFMERVSSVSAV